MDALLDRSVVGGYTRLGYAARKRVGWPADPAPGALAGRTAVVTGGGAGLGLATAAGLAALGAGVVLLVRDPARAAVARDQIRARTPGATVELIRGDVSDLDDVRRCAAELREFAPHVLVHNAGVLPATRTESAQGHELTLATHVLGPVLLTELLLPVLDDARVIMVSSGGMYTQGLPVDDPEYRDGEYQGATAYARSKRIQVALTPLLGERWSGAGTLGADARSAGATLGADARSAGATLGVHAMHPGWADTPGVTTSLPGFSRMLGPALRTPEQGADTAVWLAATEPAPPGGRFWHDRRTRPEYFLPCTGHDADDLDRIWRYCAAAIGIDAHRVDAGGPGRA